MGGNDVPVASAVEIAVEDAKAAIETLGNPDIIRTYQEESSEDQVESWFWIEKRTVMSFILGVKNGEVMTW